MAADQSANNKKGDLTTILLSTHDVLKLNQKGSELEFSASPSLFMSLGCASEGQTGAIDPQRNSVVIKNPTNAVGHFRRLAPTDKDTAA